MSVRSLSGDVRPKRRKWALGLQFPARQINYLLSTLTNGDPSQFTPSFETAATALAI